MLLAQGTLLVCYLALQLTLVSALPVLPVLLLLPVLPVSVHGFRPHFPQELLPRNKRDSHIRAQVRGDLHRVLCGGVEVHVLERGLGFRTSVDRGGGLVYEVEMVHGVAFMQTVPNVFRWSWLESFLLSQTTT